MSNIVGLRPPPSTFYVNEQVSNAVFVRNVGSG